MKLWKRPELIWRTVLVLLLVPASFFWLPEPMVLSSFRMQLALPDPPVQSRLAALTFDDGPMPETTAALLDGLKQRGVPATFFLVGSQLADNTGLVQRMAREGHQLGVHTFDHVLLTGMEQEDYVRQVEGTRRALYELLGERELWLRPPYGILDESVTARAGSPVVLWSVDPEDWKDRNAGRIRDHVLSRVQDGDIILLHDIYPSTVEAALAIVDAMQQQGYRFVTVQQLLQLRGIEAQAGVVYKHAPPGAGGQSRSKPG